MPEISLKGLNFFQYISRSQYTNKPVDGILLQMACILLRLRLQIIHKNGVWRSFEGTGEPDCSLIHLGGQKFRPTQVGK